jgi:hypothetical protein
LQKLHVKENRVAILPPPVNLGNRYIIFEELAEGVERLNL